jgi:hypothetical protein
VLLGERGPQRAVVFLDAHLAGLRARARPSGATVNDVLLAAVAAGYRETPTEAGEAVLARLPVSVPVALARRGTSAHGSWTGWRSGSTSSPARCLALPSPARWGRR